MPLRFTLVLLAALLFSIQIRAQQLQVSAWQKIIPSNTLPQGVNTRNSNNNLDVTEFNGRYYVGFRTAPSHFASTKTKLYVLSTTDFENWQVEQEVFMASDLREPRFYVGHDTLFFMFFNGGESLTKFQPKGIFQTHFTKNKWANIVALDLPLGYVPWRIKPHNGTYYLSTYEGIYEYILEEPCETRFFVSTDGYHWDSLSYEPQIDHPRASAEGAFVFADNGDMWGVARLEFDGSYIFHGKKDSLDKWDLWFSKHKFDSSLMFTHKGQIFLIARRNLDGDGSFAKKHKKYKRNLVRYSLTRKTTAIYLLDTTNKALVHIMDLASTGDCAFPGIVQINDSTYHLLNYSSNIEGRRKTWIRGQLGKTFIYKTILTITDGPIVDLVKKRVFQFSTQLDTTPPKQ